MGFTDRQAWSIISRSLRRIDELDPKVKNSIYSLVVYGSLVRGDFLPDISDIDIMLVMKMPDDVFPEENARKILKILDEESEKHRTQVPRGRHHGTAVVDSIAFGEPQLPIRGRTPVDTNSMLASPEIKPLAIYAFDFAEHNRVLLGENFIPQLDVKPPTSFIPKRAEGMRPRLEVAQRDQPAMLPLIAGEALRMAELNYGKPDLDRRNMLENFVRYVPDFPLKAFAHKLYTQYLDVNYFSNKSYEEIEEFYKLCFDFGTQIADLVLNQALA